MTRAALALRATAFVAILSVASCQDVPDPLSPSNGLDSPQPSASALTGQEARSLHAQAVPEVLALPQTVFGAFDDDTNQLVFGVEHAGVMKGVQEVMSRLGAPASAYRVEVTEPISFASTTLRTEHRPTRGGIQIHWSNYVCTLGFNVDHSAGRSFITNSHCTEQQGTTGTTAYYQPASSINPTAIATEADDPSYFKGGVCSRGKVCRYSDSSRALYASGTDSNRGDIAKTTGENNGSLDVAGSFTVATQDNSSTSFSGTVHKVGRTTGWSSGDVTNTCATVNVSGSNIQLLCQTLVQRSGSVIVQGGDSGSPVFKRSSGDDVELVGILWGGNSSGDLFVFSPLKSIQDELGGLTATADGSGGGDGGGDDGGGDGGDGGDECVPRGPNGNNCK